MNLSNLIRSIAILCFSTMLNGCIAFGGGVSDSDTIHKDVYGNGIYLSKEIGKVSDKTDKTAALIATKDMLLNYWGEPNDIEEIKNKEGCCTEAYIYNTKNYKFSGFYIYGGIIFPLMAGGVIPIIFPTGHIKTHINLYNENIISVDEDDHKWKYSNCLGIILPPLGAKAGCGSGSSLTNNHTSSRKNPKRGPH